MFVAFLLFSSVFSPFKKAETNDFYCRFVLSGLGQTEYRHIDPNREKKAVKLIEKRKSHRVAGVALFELITIFYAKTFFTIFLSVSVLKIPPSIDFAVTWFAISNGFWNPFLYWLLNAHFRSISHDMITSKVRELNAVRKL